MAGLHSRLPENKIILESRAHMILSNVSLSPHVWGQGGWGTWLVFGQVSSLVPSCFHTRTHWPATRAAQIHDPGSGTLWASVQVSGPYHSPPAPLSLCMCACLRGPLSLHQHSVLDWRWWDPWHRKPGRRLLCATWSGGSRRWMGPAARWNGCRGQGAGGGGNLAFHCQLCSSVKNPKLEFPSWCSGNESD